MKIWLRSSILQALPESQRGNAIARKYSEQCNGFNPCFPPGENMKALSFLPLNHIFERMVTYLYLYKGISIYYAESLETIGDNLKELKPHLFTTVPGYLKKYMIA